MKRFVIIGLLTASIFACRSRYVPTYEFPPGISEDERLDYQEMADEGYELYTKHCGSCHGITERGDRSMPNFTQAQIDTYEAAFNLGDSTNHAFVAGLTKRNLDYIFLFLDYRVKE